MPGNAEVTVHVVVDVLVPVELRVELAQVGLPGLFVKVHVTVPLGQVPPVDPVKFAEKTICCPAKGVGGEATTDTAGAGLGGVNAGLVTTTLNESLAREGARASRLTS